MDVKALLCILICQNAVYGLYFDPFKSLLLSLEESAGNGTHEKELEPQPEPPHTPFQTEINKTVSEKIVSEKTINKDIPITDASQTESKAVALLKEKLDKFVSVPLNPDYKFLSDTEKSVLNSLIKAATLMDPIFDHQVWTGNHKRMKELEKQNTPLSKLQLKYMEIMRGPWDRCNNDKPFAIDRQKPAAGGFYPEDMTEKQFQFYVGSNPNKREDLESPVTLVKRQEEAAVYPVPLYAVPYSQAYEEWLEPASEYLREAANITDNESLKKFLNSRADAFLSNDYSESDKDWTGLDSRVQIAVGPYGVQEDNLKGLKASFEAIVYLSEQTFKPKFRTLLPETETEYAELLPELEANLPVPEEVKNKFPSKSSIHVANLVFASGSAKKYPQHLTFDYPSNETFRAEQGSRKIVLSNVIFAFYNNIINKISQKIMKSKQLSFLDEDAFFMNVLYRELSHSLGPKFIGNDETRGVIKQVLGVSHEPLEEAKAGAMGVFNLARKVEKESFSPDFKNKVLFTYIVSLLQHVRDHSEDHKGKGAAIQLNRYLEEGSIVLLGETNPDAGRFQVNFRKLDISINKLVGDLVVLQHKGDKDAANKMLVKYGTMNSELVQEKLSDIPVDIWPTEH